jgi:hypothetical protein
MFRSVTRGKGKIGSFVTRLLCVFAVLSFGFSSNASAGARQISPLELAAYMLPDGSVPVLCVTIPGGAGSGKLVKLHADTLAVQQPAALPAPQLGAGLLVRSSFARWVVPATASLHHRLYPPGSGPRAPPATI